jgi:arylsulfatase A-like enzyme
MALYFGMVKCVDDNVGKILAALKKAEVLEKTFIDFTSDHGDLCGEHGRYDKGVPMEASARIPFLIYAPGAIKPGKVVRQALATVDFKPTILTLMGIKNPAKDDGRDASTLFLDEPQTESWKDVTFIRFGTMSGDSPSGAWMGAFSRRLVWLAAVNPVYC